MIKVKESTIKMQKCLEFPTTQRVTCCHYSFVLGSLNQNVV